MFRQKLAGQSRRQALLLFFYDLLLGVFIPCNDVETFDDCCFAFYFIFMIVLCT